MLNASENAAGTPRYAVICNNPVLKIYMVKTGKISRRDMLNLVSRKRV